MICLIVSFDGKRPMGAIGLCGAVNPVRSASNPYPKYTADVNKVTCKECLKDERIAVWLLNATSL